MTSRSKRFREIDNPDHVTNEKIWLTAMQFWTDAAAKMVDDPDNITTELMMSLMASGDAIEAVAEALNVSEKRVDTVIDAMLHPEWSRMYERLVFPLERSVTDEPVPGIHVQEYIYLIYDYATKLFKIGLSKDPTARLNAMNRARATATLEMIHVFPADNVLRAEKELHEMFAEVRTEREWFDLSDQHVQAIEAVIEYRGGNFIFGSTIPAEEEE